MFSAALPIKKQTSVMSLANSPLFLVDSSASISPGTPSPQLCLGPSDPKETRLVPGSGGALLPGLILVPSDPEETRSAPEEGKDVELDAAPGAPCLRACLLGAVSITFAVSGPRRDRNKLVPTEYAGL